MTRRARRRDRGLWGGLGAAVPALGVAVLALALGAGVGCTTPSPDEDAVRRLRLGFPGQAERALGRTGGAPLVATRDGAGFVLRDPREVDPRAAARAALRARGGLRATFPAAGEGAVRLRLADGFTLEVREAGLTGPGRPVGAAVAYRHGAAGASFWSADDRGYEEWLLRRLPVAGPLATWEVRGARLRARGAAVAVLDARGRPRLTVTAPAAFAEDGTPLAVRLAVAGSRLALMLDASPALQAHGWVLVDPQWMVTPGAPDSVRFNHTATLLPSGQVLVVGGLAHGTRVPRGELYDPLTGAFTPTAGALVTPRESHTATLLPSGQVLLAGGTAVGFDTLAAGERYDPVTGEFTPTSGSLATARSSHTATLLRSGKVLITGGMGDVDWIGAAELYDPATDHFLASAASLATARINHTATLLPAGQVLVAGGVIAGWITADTAELYDPAADAFTPVLGRMTTIRSGHTATLLPSGQVLLAGGQDEDGELASAELFDPAAAAFTATNGPLATARASHTATLLPSGQVLLAGGTTPGADFTVAASAELYDPTAGTFTPTTDPLVSGRTWHTATLLPTGAVLVVGGVGVDLISLGEAELFAPVGGSLATGVGPLTTPRARHTATLLAGGQVLLASGAGSGGTAELYDPATGDGTATSGATAMERMEATATLLSSGEVLLAGGFWYDTSPHSTTLSELYDPATDSFAATASPLQTSRWGHTATLLPSGRVLVAGGFGGPDIVLATAEIYDPATRAYSAPAGLLATARRYHSATLLPSGKVLLAGGTGDVGVLDSAELFEPATGTFAPTAGPLATARRGHTATLLPSGRVLLAGGVTTGDLSLASAELYDPATGLFTATHGGLASARHDHTATLLPAGRVLLAGGTTDGLTSLASVELYDPMADTFTLLAAALATARDSHTATLLPSGKVLLAGGFDGVDFSDAVELFDEARGAQPAWTPTLAGPLPPVRPGGTLAASGTLFTGVSEGSSSRADSSATNSPLLLLSGRTYERLAYATVRTWTASDLTATIPATLPPGAYTAWVVVNGVLSEGQSLTLYVSPPGAACSDGYECAGGHCVAGYCCDTRCDLACEACDGGDRGWSGAVNGTCATAPAGFAGRTSCEPYACNGTAPDCPASCDDDLHCATGNFCAPGRSCQLVKANGGTCDLNADCRVPGCRECASGHCVDGYCCDAACGGRCDTCAQSAGASANGTCTVLPAGSAGINPSCAPYACDGTAGECPTSCAADSDCAAGHFCATDATCQPQEINGKDCVRDGQCTSGTCVDGVCCNEACDAPCHFCRLGLYAGTCMPVPDDSDPRKECQAATGGSPACAGACVAGQCAFPDVGKSCGLCAACDGTGRCTATPPDDDDCGVIDCSGLDTACRAYPDLSSDRCAALGTCKPANDVASCTQWTDLACTDGGVPPADGGGPATDAGSGDGGGGGCSCTVRTGRGGMAGVLVMLLAGLLRRRRRAR